MWRLVLPSSPCLGVWAGLSSFWVCLWPMEVVHSADPNMQGMNTELCGLWVLHGFSIQRCPVCVPGTVLRVCNSPLAQHGLSLAGSALLGGLGWQLPTFNYPATCAGLCHHLVLLQS